MIRFPLLTADTAPRFVILANGEFPRTPLLLSILDRAAADPQGMIVCCDGATQQLLDYGLTPDAVVGDLDSVGAAALRLPPERLHHIGEQETNDLTKAVTFSVREYAPASICILGASGRREDHLLGNVSLLPHYARLCERVVMPTDYGCFLAFDGEAEICVGHPDRQLSVFSFGGSRVAARGLVWPMPPSPLSELWQGTLNRSLSDTIRLSSDSPLVLFLADELR